MWVKVAQDCIPFGVWVLAVLNFQSASTVLVSQSGRQCHRKIVCVRRGSDLERSVRNMLGVGVFAIAWR